jgi:ABC-2 type transport system permease protein
MKIGKLTGWQLVYQFTFLQTAKSKTIKIMTILLCTVLLLSMPIAQLISTVMEKKSVTQIKTVYVVDESGLGVADYSDIAIENDRYKDVEFLYPDKSATEITEELKNTEDASVLLHITAEQGTYCLRFIKPAKSSIKSEELTRLSTLVTNSFNKNRIRLLGISEEQMKLADAPIITEVKKYNQKSTSGNMEKNENGGDVQALSLPEYSLVIAVIVIIIMFFAFGGEAVASSIITEKSTRVIEYLMISVRPLAIITGKVLAMLTVTLLQFTLLGLSFMLSCFLKRSMYPQGDLLPGILKGIPIKEILSNASPVNLTLSLLIFIGGFLFFALLAGLTGATVSKIEELAEGIMVFKLTLIIGAY